jgi:hypothetical protein
MVDATSERALRVVQTDIAILYSMHNSYNMNS